MASTLRRAVKTWGSKSREVPLLWLAVAAVGGAAIDRWLHVSTTQWVSLFLIAACVAVARWWRPTVFGTRIWIALIVMTACCIGLRHHQEVLQFRSATVLPLLDEEDEPAMVTARIDEAVRLQLDPLAAVRGGYVGGESMGLKTRMTVRLESIRRGLEDRPISGRVLVIVDSPQPHLRPGDRLRLGGQMSAFGPPTNPGERDLRIWAAANHLHAMMRVRVSQRIVPLPRLAPLSWPQRWERWIAGCAASARQTLLEHAGDHGALAVALVLGQRDLLPDRDSERLMVTGTAHLLSVSGLHLAIVILSVRGLGCLLGWPQRWQVVWMVVTAVFYVAITGGRPPVMRSAILLATMLLAVSLGRPHQPLNALSLAAIILACAIPQQVFGIGVLLSFTAVATLLMSGSVTRGRSAAAIEADRLETQFDVLVAQSDRWWWRRLRGGWQMLLQVIWYSGCVSVMTMPLVWHQFHVVSPVSVLVNVLLSPMMMVALMAGVMTVVGGWFVSPLAAIAGWGCRLILGGMDRVLRVAESIPGGHVWLPSPPTWWVILFYVGVGLILVWPLGRVLPAAGRSFSFRFWSGRRGWLCTWAALWWLAGWSMATTPAGLPSGSVEATFVDVGHGTAVIVRPTRDKIWLYDCGWMGNLRGSSRGIDDAIWQLGATEIQAVILSHADSDHYNAFPALARRFKVQCVVTPPGMLSEQGETLDETIATIKRQQIPVLEIFRGQRLRQLQDSWVEPLQILHPPHQRVDGTDNANSLVVRWDHGEGCLVLPGDVEPPGTRMLTTSDRPPPGGVLMAPHHGSLQMDADVVLHWCRPRHTVVSGGRRAQRVEVRELLSQAGGEVHVTSEVGAVRVRLDEQGRPSIRHWRRSPW